jgi:PadR family transcriptional regulator PadR
VRKLQGVLLGSTRLTFETSHDTIHSNTRYIAINRHNHNDDRGQHWEAQLRKGCLEMARQASLWQSRLYGLEILRSLSVRSQLDVAERTLYPILSGLKAEGLLQSEWVEAEAGHPRKYYRLTAPGRRRAREMAEVVAHLCRQPGRPDAANLGRKTAMTTTDLQVDDGIGAYLKLLQRKETRS